jgi:hypothetical protein
MATHRTSSILTDLSIVSTVVDAAMALARGERVSAAFLLAAAALSRRIPGLGTVASLLVRLARRLR